MQWLDIKDRNTVCLQMQVMLININDLQPTLCCCIYHSDNWFPASRWWQSRWMFGSSSMNCWYYWWFIEHRGWRCPGRWRCWFWWRHQWRPHIMSLNKCSWRLRSRFCISASITQACHSPHLTHYNLTHELLGAHNVNKTNYLPWVTTTKFHT